MRIGIKKLLILSVSIIIVIGMCSITVSSYVIAKKAILDLTVQFMGQSTGNSADAINRWLHGRFRDLENWSDRKVFQSATEDSFIGKTARKALNTTLKHITDDYAYYLSMNVVSIEGEIIASSLAENLSSKFFNDKDFFKTALAGESIIESSKDKEEGFVFYIATPIELNEKVSGILVGVVNFDIFNDMFVHPTKIGKDGYAFLYDDSGLILGHKNKNNELFLNILSLDFGKDLLKSYKGMVFYNFEGRDKVAVYQQCDNVPWRIAVSAYTSDLLLPVRRVGITSLAIMILMLGICISILYLVGSSILKPLMNVVNILKEISDGRGDLTKRIDIVRNDEIGDLAKYFNLFVEKVKNIVLQVKNSSDKVSSSSLTILESSKEFSTSMNGQAAQMNEISRSVNHLAESAVDIDKIASDVTAASQKTAERALNGDKVVADAIDGMNIIKGSSENISALISALSRRSSDISGILDMLYEVTDRTNILSVNAAIESAKAGDFGAGFNVVATSIRDLSENSLHATEEINSSINDINTNIENLVSFMNKNNDSISSGVDRTNRAGVMIREIAQNIVNFADLMKKIASSAQLQSKSVQEISGSLSNINTALQNIAQITKNAEISASGLTKVAQELKQGVSQFKVD